MECEALHHFELDGARQGKPRAGDSRIDESGPVMRQGCVRPLARILDPNAVNAGRFGHGRDIRIVKPSAKIEEAARFLLNLDEAECAVINDDDLHRQLELREA
jgi:hypothetical protein